MSGFAVATSETPENLDLLPADFAEVLAEGESLQVVDHHILRALQRRVIGCLDPHRQHSVAGLKLAAAILGERYRALFGGELDREFVAPVFADLLEIAAGRCCRHLRSEEHT